MKGPGQVALLLLAQPQIRIHEWKVMGGPAVFVPVKVTVCVTLSVARYRRMPGVLLRM